MRLQIVQHSEIIFCNNLSDTEPDYTMDELISKYNKYVLLPSNYKSISNDYSIEIWGRSGICYENEPK